MYHTFVIYLVLLSLMGIYKKAIKLLEMRVRAYRKDGKNSALYALFLVKLF